MGLRKVRFHSEAVTLGTPPSHVLHPHCEDVYLVPSEWQHQATYIVGFSDEISNAERRDAVKGTAALRRARWN
jgi:hypothetical protein